MELQTGRPKDEMGREEKEIRVYDLLDSLQIPYERVDHEEVATIEMCHDVEKVLQIRICKNLFLCNRQKTQYYMLVMPGEKKFKTKDLSAQIQSARLSFADAADMERLLDITPGSVSITGLMNDTENQVQLLVDEEVLWEPYFGCHPCKNTSSLKLKTSDVMDIFIPAVHHQKIVVKLPSYEE